MEISLKVLVVWTVPKNKEAFITLFGDHNHMILKIKCGHFLLKMLVYFITIYTFSLNSFLSFIIYRFPVQVHVSSWPVLL